MDQLYCKVWDIRYVYAGEKWGYCWEVFCLAHGEVDAKCTHTSDAIEHAEYLNKQENGPHTRIFDTIQGGTGIPIRVTEHWEHTPCTGFGAGWR